jgi:hypothetical protein
MVVVEHAAKPLAPQDAAARGGVVIRRNDELVAEALVIALSVIVREVFCRMSSRRCFSPQRYDSSQTLAPD